MSTAITRGRFNYIRPSIAPSDPRTPLPLGLGECPETTDDWTVSVEKTVRNGRDHRFTLGRDGFELLKGVSLPLPSTVSGEGDHGLAGVDGRKLFYSSRETFVPLATKLVRERLGLPPCFGWHFVPPLVRTAPAVTTTTTEGTAGGGSGGDGNVGNHALGTLPHAMVHNDYGFGYISYLRRLDPADGPLGVRDPAKAEALCRLIRSAGRVVVLQFWTSAQPPGTVVENDTLALCHPRSVSPSDLVTRPLPTYDGRPLSGADYARILQSKDSEGHEWFHWPRMRTGDECLCWVGYDSAWEEGGGEDHGGADGPDASTAMWKPCLHSSFRDPSGACSPPARPRESMECRVILFLDQRVPARL